MNGVHISLHNLLDGEVRVVSRRDCASKLLDSVDGFCTSSRYDDIDWSSELILAASEQFHAVLDTVYTSGLVELFQGDGLRRIESALVDPILDAVEIDLGHIDREGILEASLSSYHPIWRLSTIEAGRDFSVLLLTLMTTPRCLSLPTGWSSTSSDALIVGTFRVGQGGQNRGVALLTEEGVEERRDRLIRWLGWY